jgi:hypothetical protein
MIIGMIFILGRDVAISSDRNIVFSASCIDRSAVAVLLAPWQGNSEMSL